MSWKVFGLKLVIIAVGIYFARIAFTLQKEIVSLKLNVLRYPTPQNTSLLAQKEEECKRAGIIAAICIVPLVILSIVKSMFWIALVAIAGLVIAKFMN